MQFRKAHADELAQLNLIIEPYLSPAFNWPPASFNSEFAHSETWVLIEPSAGDERVIAFCCIRDSIDAWEISLLATIKTHQGQGLMRHLLTRILQHYGRKRHFWLEVHESNVRAQKLYEQFGFIKEGHRGGYYTDGSSAYLYTLPKLAE